jgi:prepilin-type processing-associated H-X9-DG protein
LIVPTLGRPREPAQRVKCASNLRQIGQGIQMYANENRGAFPPSFDAVLSTQDLTPEVFVCPSSDHERATGPTTQAVVASFLSNPNLHCSYVYTGAGLTSATATPKHVLAYEHATNHKDGMNVLYGDGTVQWVDAKQSAHLLSELTAGHNPPR